MSEVGDLITSATHALEQVESVAEGCLNRSRTLEDLQGRLNNAGGKEAARVALACAHGAEGDVFTALNRAAAALRQEIGHLQGASSPPPAGP